MADTTTFVSDGLLTAPAITPSPILGVIVTLVSASNSVYFSKKGHRRRAIKFTSGSRASITSSLTLSSSVSSSSRISIDTLTSKSTLLSSSSSTRVAQPTSATAQPSNSLSTGAKAGIGIGAAGGAVLLMLLGAFFGSIVRRRKRKDDRSTYNRVEPDSQVQRQMSRKELDGNNVLGRNTSRKELDGTYWKRELEGDTPKGLGKEPL
ncbi:hypothetical protein MMC34_001485 [Xylographa carneopallida]|nr:hypothetical protein [Xylographa carneopallida]